MAATLVCVGCQRQDLTEADFSVLSLHILKLNPNSRNSLRCAPCLSVLRGDEGQQSPRKAAAKGQEVHSVAAARSATAAVASVAATKPSTDFSADDALDLGEAILETSTIAPSEVGSDDDLEDDLAAAGLDDEEDDVPFEGPALHDVRLPASTALGCGASLTSAALAEHENRTDAIDRRQFNCPKHGTFWRKVIARKPVARCEECGGDGPKYEPIPIEEERGRGLFRCGDCGNQWTSNSACRGLAQYCQGKGCRAFDLQKGTFPHQMRPQLTRAKMREKRAAREAALRTGSRGASTLHGVPLDGIPEDSDQKYDHAPAESLEAEVAAAAGGASSVPADVSDAAGATVPRAVSSYAAAAAGERGDGGEGDVILNGRDGDVIGVGGAAAYAAQAVMYGPGGRGKGVGGGPNSNTIAMGGGGGGGGAGGDAPAETVVGPPMNADGDPLRAPMPAWGGGGAGSGGGGGGGRTGKGERGVGGGKGGGRGGKGGGPISGGYASVGRGMSVRDHFCSGCATGACRRPPPLSKVHVPTGSTASCSISTRTWSSAGSIAFTEGSTNSFFLPREPPSWAAPSRA